MSSFRPALTGQSVSYETRPSDTLAPTVIRPAGVPAVG